MFVEWITKIKRDEFFFNILYVCVFKSCHALQRNTIKLNNMKLPIFDFFFINRKGNYICFNRILFKFKVRKGCALSLLLFILFIFIFWLCWVFVSVRGLSLVAASGGHSSSRCAGLSLSWPLLLRSTGSRRAGSVIVAHGPSCSAACGIFPDQGSNPCPLHWQANSQPLRHQGSPKLFLLRAR